MLTHPYFKLKKIINGKILELEIGDIEIRPYSNFYSPVTPNECRLNNIDYSLEIIIKGMSINLDIINN